MSPIPQPNLEFEKRCRHAQLDEYFHGLHVHRIAINMYNTIGTAKVVGVAPFRTATLLGIDILSIRSTHTTAEAYRSFSDASHLSSFTYTFPQELIGRNIKCALPMKNPMALVYHEYVAKQK